MVATVQARRQDYLDSLADAALAEADAAEAARREIAQAENAEARRRHRLRAEAAQHRDARFRGMAKCAKAAKALMAAFESVIAAAEAERTALSALGAFADSVSGASVRGRLSRYLSSELRSVEGNPGAGFGEMKLAQHFPQAGKPWLEAERKATAGLASTDNGEDNAS